MTSQYGAQAGRRTAGRIDDVAMLLLFGSAAVVMQSGKARAKEIRGSGGARDGRERSVDRGDMSGHSDCRLFKCGRSTAVCHKEVGSNQQYSDYPHWPQRSGAARSRLRLCWSLSHPAAGVRSHCTSTLRSSLHPSNQRHSGMSTLVDDVSFDSRLVRLPSPLFDLILCHLPLYDKLNHCSHLSKCIPPINPAACRYDELQLTVPSASRLLSTPTLHSLLSQVSSLSCRSDQWVVVPTYDAHGRVMAFGVCAVELPLSLHTSLSHFSALTRLSIHCPPFHLPDTQQVPLLSLQSSESTIRSFAFHSISLHTSSSWLLSIVSPMSALRSLSLAVTLHPDCLTVLLQQPLHVLDLCGSRLSRDATPHLPEQGWLLATNCRVLRLPTSRFLVSDCYLDSIIERLPVELTAVGRQLHTLAINHVMAEGAVKAALSSPPPQNLHIAIEGHRADIDHFLPHATALPQLNPPNVHLRVVGRHWHNLEKVQLCLDFLTRHSTHIRSVDVSVRRQPSGQTQLAHKLLAALSHCSRLQSVVLQACESFFQNRNAAVHLQWLSQPAPWAQQIWLPHLRSLTVAHVAEADLCRWIVVCHSLTYCEVDVQPTPLGVLSLLASSCPQLQSLHVRCVHDVSRSQDEEKEQQQSQPLVPFRSLTSLTLPGFSGWLTDKTALSADTPLVQSLLAGSPVRRLQLVNWHTDLTHVNALLPILLLLPRLEVMVLRDDEGRRERPPAASWDQEPPTDDEGRPMMADPRKNTNGSLCVASVALSSTSTLSSACPSPPHPLYLTASSLHSLELTVHPDTTLTSLFSLLSNTPHLTAITVTVQDSTASGVAVSVLHLFGLLGMYAPVLDTVRFRHQRLQSASSFDLEWELDLPAVRSIAACYPLPTHAFAQLRHVQQAEMTAVAKTERSTVALLSVEAVEWLQGEWFGKAPIEGTTALTQLMGAFIVD